MFKKFLFTATATILPIFAFAQKLKETTSILEKIQALVTDILIPIAFTLALLVFFWGMVKYIWSDAGKGEGKQIMLWGIIALFVMASVWGLVSFLRSELGVGSDTDMKIPTINGRGSGVETSS